MYNLDFGFLRFVLLPPGYGFWFFAPNEAAANPIAVFAAAFHNGFILPLIAIKKKIMGGDTIYIVV